MAMTAIVVIGFKLRSLLKYPMPSPNYRTGGGIVTYEQNGKSPTQNTQSARSGNS
jgi:hypothetical protein